MSLLNHFIDLFVISAPWLILGFTIAGLIKGFVPEDLMSKHLTGNSHWTVVKAALIGAPLPLCSCGVIPAAMGLRQAGASKKATVSFLVATPETGLDSVAVSYAMLGPFMAVIRPIAAIFSAILSGILAGYSEKHSEEVVPLQQEPVKSCCGSQKAETVEEKPTLSFIKKSTLGLSFSFGKMMRDIVIWLLIGLLFAAAVKTWVPASLLAEWGSSWYAFIAMAVIGVPMYICATASTPIAAGLLLSGISPGAVLVFMMAGPATNIGTLGIISKELGRHILWAYLAGVVIASFIFGYLCNWLVDTLNIDIIAQAPMEHGITNPLLDYGSALLLAVFVIRALYQKFLSHRKSIGS